MNELDRNEPAHAGEAAFATTRWSMVLQAGQAGVDANEAHKALSALCQAYWVPLYSFARRRGMTEDDAKDAIQGFFAHMLERDLISRAQPDRGRFRSYLLGALKLHLSNEGRREAALKRGGNSTWISIDTELGEQLLQSEAATTSDPEQVYHRSWAQALLNETLTRLKDQYAKTEKLALFQELEPHLTASDRSLGSRDSIAKQFGITEGAVNLSLHRMRGQFGKLLREVIGETVASPSDVEDELDFLRSVLRDSPSKIS